MTKSFCLLLILISIEKFESALLLPYGPKSNDLALPKDRSFSYAITNLSVNISFFNKLYSSFHINSNGYITFQPPINPYFCDISNELITNSEYRPCTFPTSIPVIAPFWSFLNTKNGQIYYRESSNSTDLIQVKNDISRIDSSFNPTRVYIITWNKVPSIYYTNNYYTNTFQLVIATNGATSYMITNFQNMTFPNKESTLMALFGYNAGDNKTYFTHPNSFTYDLTNVAKTSNVNIPGKWVHKLAFNESLLTTTTSITTKNNFKVFEGIIEKTLTPSDFRDTFFLSLAELNDGNIAIASGIDIQIWNLTNGQLVRKLKGHTAQVNRIVVITFGLLASASFDNTIRIWRTDENSENGGLIKTILFENVPILRIVALKNGHVAYSTGYHSNYIRILNTRNEGTVVRTLSSDDAQASSLVSLNNYLLAVSFDTYVKVFDTQNGSILITSKKLMNQIFSMILLPDGTLAIGGDNNIIILNPNDGNIIKSFNDNYTKGQLSVLPNDLLASVVYGRLVINLWNYKTGEFIKNMQAPPGLYLSPIITLKDGRLVSASFQGNIVLWK